ncbi:MAG: polysaccharide export protein [Proteobacteria bacterium]|nr:polysaccharide export protein [Pseudomonadota bacterium]
MRKTSFFKYLIIAMVIIPGAFSDFILSAQDYTIGTGDVIELTVYEHNDLQSRLRVDGNGNIDLPLIGKIQVAGLSLEEIKSKITNLFADGYLINPQVTLTIAEYGSKRAVILGQVVRPGIFELRENATLLELISKAGGLTKTAGANATIKRKTRFLDETESTVINIDLNNLVEKGDSSLNIPVLDGDSIYISKASDFFVTGEVKKPDVYKWEKNLTIIKAIALAGGLTGKASSVNIRIIRKVDNKEIVLTKVKMDTIVMPDDVIVVPESFF